MLYFLATPIGNISDVTFRALEILESCNIILCEDTRVCAKYISILQSRGMLKNSSFQFTSFHSHNESFKIANLGVDFFAQDVIFMSDAGMPCISDPGAKLVQFAQNNNIPYTIIPAASASVCAFAMSGFEDSRFTFISFLPHKISLKTALLRKILDSGEVFVCFESMHRIQQSIQIIAQIAPDSQIFAIKEMTKLHEKYFFGKAREVFEAINNTNINGEWTLVLRGQAARQNAKTLGIDDILALDIPPKIKAKILSKLSDKSVQECYNEILKKARE